MAKQTATRILGRIQKKANDKFGSVMKPVDNSDVLMVFDARLKQDMPTWKRKYYESMRKDFAVEKLEVDEGVAKQRDEYVEKEISKAVKSGKLPPPPKQ